MGKLVSVFHYILWIIRSVSFAIPTKYTRSACRVRRVAVFFLHCSLQHAALRYVKIQERSYTLCLQIKTLDSRNKIFNCTHTTKFILVHTDISICVVLLLKIVNFLSTRTIERSYHRHLFLLNMNNVCLKRSPHSYCFISHFTMLTIH